jgi:hypothetical protein
MKNADAALLAVLDDDANLRHRHCGASPCMDQGSAP